MARSLEVIGERWTLLIVRELFLGLHRFEDLHRSLGVARNILQARLELLGDEGVIERRPYQEGRFEYHLTAKGAELWPILMTLMRWGDRHYANNGAPRLIKHRECGGEVAEDMTCAKCGQSLGVTDVYWEWGPGKQDSQALPKKNQSARSPRGKPSTVQGRGRARKRTPTPAQ